MNSLPHSQRFLLEAAEGWLMLGNPIEANEELEKVSPDYRFHPSVLSVRWQVYAAAEWWEAAWVISKALCDLMPNCAEVWICQGNTLRKYRGVQEAHDLLMNIVDRFPTDAVIRYNLACYCAQEGRMDEACQWLSKAFGLENSAALKIAACYDPDLKPLWEKIAQGNPQLEAELAGVPR